MAAPKTLNLTSMEATTLVRKAFETDPHGVCSEWWHPSETWDLNLGPEKSFDLAIAGLHEKVPECQALIDKVTPSLLVEHEAQKEVWGVTGAVFDNAALIAGLPDYAMDFEQRPETLQAVKIVIAGFYSGGVDATKLARRAQAITALLATLNAIGHPVELVMFTAVILRRDGTVYHTTVQLHNAGDTTDLARLAYWAGHPAAVRNILYAAESAHWEIRSMGASGIDYAAYNAKRQECQRNGWLFIEAAHLDMVAGKYDTDAQAAAWVKAQVEALGAYAPTC